MGIKITSTTQGYHTCLTEEGWSYEFPIIEKPSWEQVPSPPGFNFDFCFINRLDLRKVIVSCAKRPDDGNKRWLHVTVSHPHRMPTYKELTEVKRLFIGKDRKAIMVFPEQENHVNIHETCLHLWCCLDEWGIPEFSSDKLLSRLTLNDTGDVVETPIKSV